ncbi:unnamed protein product [Kluyveromyces dobzhanskii CBS 2104]|uniref:WGS project CCBQ000000000 data, contig 00102 n=1 Tax=Kluyveromyces dobzhanskii CBS 2104 TaxID=1427455 RepID=A0A0A8L6R8_9SACH|nr:unnamed protein product [Kluyveromyces dobzhanskii CBS 2104]
MISPVLLILQCVILATRIVSAAPPPKVPIESSAEGSDSKLPPMLTDADFDATISKGLHIIEFFSPYCPHCKQLAAVWEKAYNDFYEESLSLNVSLHQVNCVESGDLCLKENVNAYPSIRLYGPDGFIKQFPKGTKRTEKELINFARKEALDVDNIDITKLSGKSTLVDDNQFLKLLSEPQTEPYLVSFWPTSKLEDVESAYPFSSCEDCTSFQRTWKLVSNRVDSVGIKPVHFNCANPTDSSKNEEICKELSYGTLTKEKRSKLDRYPQVAMILPNRKSGSFIRFPLGSNRVDSKSLVDFASRTLHNSNVPDIDQYEIESFVKEPKSNILKPNVDEDKILLVFSYNQDTVVHEDMQFLEQLIEPLGFIPNVYLYKSSDNLKITTKVLYKTLYAEYNTDNPLEVNEDNLIMASITQYPTFFLFKKNTFVPIIFPGYSTTETRNLDFITDWLTINSIPTVTEVTPKNFPALKNFEPDFYDKLVIQMVNMKNNKLVEGTKKLVEGLRAAAHTYEILRNEAVYEDLNTAREQKKQLVQKLKNKQAPSTEIIAAMREEINYVYNHKVIFAYLDIDEYPSFLNNQGLNAYQRLHKTGDIIVVDKEKAIYYEKDAAGQDISLKSLPHVLSILGFPARYPDASIERVFIVTPLGPLFRLLDRLRDLSGIGYLIVLMALFALWKLPKTIYHYRLRKRYTAKRDVTGILGGKNGKEAKFMD